MKKIAQLRSGSDEKRIATETLDIINTPALAGLAANPQLLTMLLHAINSGLEDFTRVRLYDYAISALSVREQSKRAKQARRTNTDILSSPAARAVLQIAAFEAHRKQLRILSYARVVELCLAELQGDRYEEQVGALEVVSALQRQVRDHHFSSANLSTLVLSTFDDSGKNLSSSMRSHGYFVRFRQYIAD